MGLLSNIGNGLPDWLPEDPSKKAAARQGLLAFGAAMLGGRGNFGQHLGQGIGAGTQTYQGALAAQQEAAQRAQAAQIDAEQLKIAQSKNARSQQTQDLISSAFSGGGTAQPAGAGGMPSGGGGAPAAQPGARKFPLTLDQVALIKASGGPDLSAEYKMAHEGFERKQGSTYESPDGRMQSFARLGDGMVQAQDGSISNARGYVGSLAESEGAKAAAVEGAKAGYDVLDPTKFIGPDGRPMANTRAGLISDIKGLPQMGSGAPPRAPVKPGAPVTPANFPRVTPQQQQARDGTRLEILQQERAKATNPADIAALDREIAGAGGGRRGAPVLQSAAEAKAQLGAVDATLSAGKGLNENWIKEVHNPVQADGKAAKSTLTQLETVKNVNFQTGWGAEAKAGAAAILGSLGVKDAATYAGNAQKFQQVAMERNMTMLAAQAGPQTEGDSQRAQQTFLKLANTPAANQFIADLTGANAREAARKAEYYNRALPLAKAGGDLTEIDRRWAKVSRSIWADPALAKYKAK